MSENFYNKNKESDASNVHDQQGTIDKLKTELQLAEMHVSDKDKVIKNLESHQSQLKIKLKKAEDQVAQLQNQYLPKIKETKKFQNELYDELEKIRQDAELLPTMFRAEALFRIECKKEKDDAVDKMTNAMKQHNKLVSERDDLKNELERKQRLAI